MDDNFIIKINQITKVIWLCMAVFGIIAGIYCYIIEDTYLMKNALLVSLISILMYGWKRFQMSKFKPKDS